MSTKIGGPNIQPQISTIQSDVALKGQSIQGQESVSKMPQTIEANKAWQDFASIKDMVPNLPTQSTQIQGNSPLRAQIALMSQQASAPARSIDAGALAQQFGINSEDLVLSKTSNVSMSSNDAFNPSVGSNTDAQAAPLAGSRTFAGPQANPARGEATAALDKIIEQSYMPFDTKSDNMARDLSKNPRLLGALNPAEKGRLIQILSGGLTGEADQKAINNVLGSAQDRNEFFGMVQMAGGLDQLRGVLFNPAQQREFAFLTDKFATDSGPANSPERAQARQTFENILRKAHQPFDTQADNMVRSLTSNPQMMDSLTSAEKGTLINLLGTGWKSEADEESVISLLRSSKSPQDFWNTVQVAGGPGQIDSILDWKEQGQFNYLQEKFSAAYNPMMGANWGQPIQNAGFGMDPTMMNNNMNMPMGNSWGIPNVNNYGGGYGMNTPPYNAGTVMGMGQPYDYGMGGQQKQSGGGFFKKLIGAVGGLIKKALPIAISAGIGFLMGGPAGAAMGAINGLLGGGGMGSMFGGGGGMMGGGMFGGDMMSGLFSGLMGGDPAGGFGSILGDIAQAAV